MLWIHEVHRTWGKLEDEFEALYRDEWMPALAQQGDAKLLYFAHLTHGSGRAYTVITVTAARDAAAYGTVAERVQHGDLKELSRELDQLRHNVTGKILTPAYWSPVIPWRSQISPNVCCT